MSFITFDCMKEGSGIFDLFQANVTAELLVSA